MNKIVVANLKMNLDNNEINDYLKNMKEKDLNNVIFCPSAIYIKEFVSSGLNTGIQNISEYENGPRTGEISAYQASSINVKYAIIGHSEIRTNFNETNEVINKKIKVCLENNIVPILCIGENKGEEPFPIIEKQLDECLKDITADKLLIAYEPDWSIGTNSIPTLHSIDSIILHIKKYIEQNNKINDIIVMYGGSVNKNNYNEIINLPNIDGVLIGNASLNAVEFLKMLEVAL